jgi:hypothetical protein
MWNSEYQIVMATLNDVLGAIKELTTVTEKVRENTEHIPKLEEKVDTLQIYKIKMRGDVKAILNRLEMKEEIAALKIQLAEHIAGCEKAKA